jgi:hypothetical protein
MRNNAIKKKKTIFKKLDVFKKSITISTNILFLKLF